MKTNFLTFLNNKNKINSITESFNKNEINDVIQLINNVLKKHIDKLLCLRGGINIKEHNKVLYNTLYIVNGGDKSFTINWDMEMGEVYSIHFFDKTQTHNILWEKHVMANLSIYTLGSSIVYFLPVIWTIVNSDNFDIDKDEAIKIGRSVYTNESYKFTLDNINYIIYENLSENDIINKYNIFVEAGKQLDNDVKTYKKKKRQELLDKYADRNNSPEDKKEFKELQKEYDEIKSAIDNGATTMHELRLALKHNVKLSLELNADIIKAETKLKEKRESPEVVFKKMAKYINMVIKGINPSVILCGAPGVGKTYRVKTQLKANGYIEGHNLHTIKGKCTPRVLYTTLYEYQDKGQVIVIDDADGLVGPKAPEDCINILKGALDSTSDDEGRLVTYGIAGKLLDDEGMPIPKRFYYRGSVIVITNYNAGSLDSALKGRSYMQDIDFTTEEVLEIVEKLIPKLDPEHLSLQSKNKAFDYLTKLAKSGTDMEISIRTFGICAKIFEACSDDPDFSDEDAQSMIKEQMELQAQKRKNKY
jgi:hypothetical protein